ncbi:cytochrome P450 family protein [Actinokineospora diospyrosa]|uniref:Cytochrome P450 n=1 Tax=Actinokineospora diospyrosa TaxID=103728 RepID=A0ABT1I8S0_9PSEU|nr:cytochrome P450 [Actinokineospora diospyrosa]MCP2268786.1 Cytochrome P450 [Actinokineospora diospyrosa]
MRPIPEIPVTDRAVLADPFTAYAQARELSPVARLTGAGMPPMFAITRHEEGKAALSDPRFALSESSFLRPPGIPEHCQRYLHTMAEMDGPEHTRVRGAAAPAFTARRTAAMRPAVEAIVERLLDTLGTEADLLHEFAGPLPMEIICELLGIPEVDRPRWREYGAAVAAGFGPGFIAAIPAIMASAEAAVAASRTEPNAGILSRLLDGPLTETELVTLVWHLVLAGQTPTNLIANGVAALFSHPEQLASLRADPDLAPRAVEELMRWCGPQLLTTPRFAAEDIDLGGAVIPAGAAMTVAIASANRDPRAYPDPDRLDITRPLGAPGHLGFSHGPHFCLGAPLARLQTEIALTALLRRFPTLSPARPETVRAPDPGTWRLAELPVLLTS